MTHQTIFFQKYTIVRYIKKIEFRRMNFGTWWCYNSNHDVQAFILKYTRLIMIFLIKFYSYSVINKKYIAKLIFMN